MYFPQVLLLLRKNNPKNVLMRVNDGITVG